MVEHSYSSATVVVTEWFCNHHKPLNVNNNVSFYPKEQVAVDAHVDQTSY